MNDQWLLLCNATWEHGLPKFMSNWSVSCAVKCDYHFSRLLDEILVGRKSKDVGGKNLQISGDSLEDFLSSVSPLVCVQTLLRGYTSFHLLSGRTGSRMNVIRS